MMLRRLLLVLFCAIPMLAAEGAQLRLERLACENCSAKWADFNGDGLDDLLLQNQLQFNLGGGRFAPPIEIDAIGRANVDIIVFMEDFNRDGFTDIVVSDLSIHTMPALPAYEGSQRILLGDGNGGFTIGPALPQRRGRAFKAADLTGDGIPDLLAYDPAAKQLLVYRNRGDASFTLHQELAWNFDNEWHGDDIVHLADINGDGRQDMIVSGERYLDFFFAQPDGKFAPGDLRYTGQYGRYLQIGDVNGDGKADLAFVMGFSNFDYRIFTLFGDGTGRFPTWSELTVPTYWQDGKRVNPSPTSLEIGDFLAGGSNEIAVAEGQGTIRLFAVQHDRLITVLQQDVPLRGAEVRLARFRSQTPELVVWSWFLAPERYGQLWAVETDGAVPEAPKRPMRTRTIGRVAMLPEDGEYRVEVDSKCPIAGFDNFTIDRDGIFVKFAPSPLFEKVEAVYLDGEIALEFTIREGDHTRVLDGSFVQQAPGTLHGRFFESGTTPCGGWQVHTIDASVITDR